MVGFIAGRFSNQDGFEPVVEISHCEHCGRKCAAANKRIKMSLCTERRSRLQAVHQGFYNLGTAAAVEAQVHDDALDGVGIGKGE